MKWGTMRIAHVNFKILKSNITSTNIYSNLKLKTGLYCNVCKCIVCNICIQHTCSVYCILYILLTNPCNIHWYFKIIIKFDGHLWSQKSINWSIKLYILKSDMMIWFSYQKGKYLISYLHTSEEKTISQKFANFLMKKIVRGSTYKESCKNQINAQYNMFSTILMDSILHFLHCIILKKKNISKVVTGKCYSFLRCTIIIWLTSFWLW